MYLKKRKLGTQFQNNDFNVSLEDQKSAIHQLMQEHQGFMPVIVTELGWPGLFFKSRKTQNRPIFTPIFTQKWSLMPKFGFFIEVNITGVAQNKTFLCYRNLVLWYHKWPKLHPETFKSKELGPYLTHRNVTRHFGNGRTSPIICYNIIRDILGLLLGEKAAFLGENGKFWMVLTFQRLFDQQIIIWH